MSETTSKKGIRWLIIIGSISAAVVVLFALLPSLLSSQWGKERALGLAAPHVPGAVTVENWSLSWFGDQKIAGIRYVDEAAGVQVDAAEVTVARGLIPFLLDRGDAGTVTVYRPEIRISLPEAASDGEGSGQPSRTGQPQTDKTESPQPDTQTVPGATGVALPPISGHLVVQEGSVAIGSADQAEPVATGINIEIDIAPMPGDIAYSIALASPGGNGRVIGNGTLALQQAPTIIGSLRPTGAVQVTGWDISQLLGLANRYVSMPTGSGILDGTLSFGGSPAERIDMDGTIDLSRLELSGGPLGEDRPSIEKASLAFSAFMDLDSIHVSSLTLSSPLADGSLSGAADAGGVQQFSTDLRIDLPALAEQVPATLNLQEGLEITGGTVTLEAEVHADQGKNLFNASALVEGLAGVRDTKNISLTEPFAFSLKGQQSTSGLKLEHVSVRSSFLEGEGQGSLDDLQLSLQADLGGALKEISKFVALQDYRAEGLLALSLEARRTDVSTIDLTAHLDAGTLALSQNKTVIIPPNPLKLEVDSALLVSRDFEFGGAAEASLSYQSWLGAGSLTGHHIMLDPDRTLQKIGDLAAKGNLNLHDLGIMLTRLGVLPDTWRIDGDQHFTLTVSGENGRFLIEDLLLDSPQLSLHKDDKRVIPGSALNIQGRGEVALGDDGSIALERPALSYRSWLGSGTLAVAAIDISKKRMNGLAFTGQTDLDKLAALFSGLGILPPDVSFSGVETSTLNMDYSPERIDLASLHTEIESFVFRQEGKTYRDQRLVIDAAGAVDMAKRQVSLTPVRIDSANGAASFERLVVGDWNKPMDTLDSAGQARFDLGTVLAAAGDWVSLPDDVSAAASVDINWTAEALSDTEHRYRLDTDLSQFSLKKAALQPFADEQASLRMNGARNPTTGRLGLDRFALTSPLLDLDAAGSWDTGAGHDTEIAVKGDLALDLDRVASFIGAFTDIDLEMAGKSKQPFELELKVSPEHRQTWWQHARFKGAFQADLIKTLGIELRSLEVPVELSNGRAHAVVTGSANQGTLQLEPHLDLVNSPPVLTIPDNSLVIDGMEITQEMANQLLARIHPLFMGATQMRGSVDLNLEHFRWPLGTESLNDLAFSGSMELHDVRLDSSALLGSLLQVLRVEETGLDLSGRQIQFACANGRIQTNPLHTNLSDSELIISGSLGLDTTIDYLAQAEVTERLVGGDLYNYLEGTTIRVPIGGTLSNPDISAQTVQRAITDLVNQAGKKKLEEAAGNLLKRLF